MSIAWREARHALNLLTDPRIAPRFAPRFYSLGSLAKAFATIYYSLFVALTGAAFIVRRRIQWRAVRIGVLVGLFLVIGVAATYASTHFFMLVNAEA